MSAAAAALDLFLVEVAVKCQFVVDKLLLSPFPFSSPGFRGRLAVPGVPWSVGAVLKSLLPCSLGCPSRGVLCLHTGSLPSAPVFLYKRQIRFHLL